MKIFPVFLISFLYLSSAFDFLQDPAEEKLLLPSGESIEIGFIDIRDELPYEWFGFAPDVRVEQTKADILAGRDKQLEYAIDMLK